MELLPAESMRAYMQLAVIHFLFRILTLIENTSSVFFYRIYRNCFAMSNIIYSLYCILSMLIACYTKCCQSVACFSVFSVFLIHTVSQCVQRCCCCISIIYMYVCVTVCITVFMYNIHYCSYYIYLCCSLVCSLCVFLTCVILYVVWRHCFVLGGT